MDDVNEEQSECPKSSTGSEPEPLDVLRRARDGLRSEIVHSGRSDLGLLEALRDISDECRRRGGSGEPDALTQVLFGWRRRQAQREAALAVVRRARGSGGQEGSAC